MQCESRNRGVRIRVHPGVRRNGVVDRQNLDEFQARMPGPIGEQFQVGEFAGTKTCFAAEAENRNRHARAFPGIGGQPDEAVVDDGVFSRREGVVQNPVVAVFKADEFSVSDIKNSVFVLNRKCLCLLYTSSVHAEQIL